MNDKNVYSMEENNDLQNITNDLPVYDRGFFSFIGYGERTIPLLKSLKSSLNFNPQKTGIYDTYHKLDYDKDKFHLSVLDKDVLKITGRDCCYCRFFILYLDEDNLDKFIDRCNFTLVYISVIIAILPKKEHSLIRRRIAISNLKRLYQEKKIGIFLIDEDNINVSICNRLIQFVDGWLYFMNHEIIQSIDFADMCTTHSKGFIYYTQNEDFPFEKAFNMEYFVQSSHLADKLPVFVDRVLFLFFFTIENEIQMEQLQIVNDQFMKIQTNTEYDIKWGMGYKNEDESDNYTCYAFFSQDKFPEYLEETKFCEVIINNKLCAMVDNLMNVSGIPEYECSFIGYGEDTYSLMKKLCKYPAKDIYDLEYNYTMLEYYSGKFVLYEVEEDVPILRGNEFGVFQCFIMRLDKESVDDFICNWDPKVDVSIIIAILPKKKYGLDNRKIAIANLRKLYDAGKCIYLIDEEKIEGEDAICREIYKLTESLFSMILGGSANIDYADVYDMLMKGFVYSAQAEDYKFEKSFCLQQFFHDSHLSDDIHARVDKALFFISISIKNEMLVNNMEYLHNQFVLLNIKYELKWGYGYRYEDEDDNFHCYALFLQDQFPEYLEKE